MERDEQKLNSNKRAAQIKVTSMRIKVVIMLDTMVVLAKCLLLAWRLESILLDVNLRYPKFSNVSNKMIKWHMHAGCLELQDL